MATEKAQKQTTDSAHEQMFSNWVYQIPGLLLMAGGFGALLFMSLT